jgi:hypothetical protein
MFWKEFSPVEKSMVLKVLTRFGVREEEIIKRCLPILGLSPNKRAFRLYLLLSELEQEIKDALREERISIHTAKRLLEVSGKDRMVLFYLIKDMSFGVQREVLSNIFDIAKRDGVSVCDLIKELSFHNIREGLKRKRYPMLFQKREEFEERLKRLNLPSAISVRHHPSFEEERLNVEFSFSTEEELKGLLPHIERLHELLGESYEGAHSEGKEC